MGRNQSVVVEEWWGCGLCEEKGRMGQMKKWVLRWWRIEREWGNNKGVLGVRRSSEERWRREIVEVGEASLSFSDILS